MGMLALETSESGGKENKHLHSSKYSGKVYIKRLGERERPSRSLR